MAKFQRPAAPASRDLVEKVYPYLLPVLLFLAAGCKTEANYAEERAENAALPEHLVYQSGLAVVDVRYYGYISYFLLF